MSDHCEDNLDEMFSAGRADEIARKLASLSGLVDAESMWQRRALTMLYAVICALCELRDSQEIILDARCILEHIDLGAGLRSELLGDGEPQSIKEVSGVAWAELSSRPGAIGLYLRSLRGEFSAQTRRALEAYFGSLPGFNLEDAISGRSQSPKTQEMHSFVSMQTSKPLGRLADG